MTKVPDREPGVQVALGMVTYNGERHVRQAIESLLAQTWGEFTLTIVDDASTDRTPEIVAEYAARDPRVTLVRHPHRLGYVGNAVSAFTHAPRADLFAWASDHDAHAPRWLEALVAALRQTPDAVLAYPLATRISDTGERLPVAATRFATCGLSRAEGALSVARDGVGFGNMVYGLFRASALRAAGVLRPLLLPDVVLVTEIARAGCIVQVPEELWHRRYADLFSVERQRRNLFARMPWWVRLPPGLVNPVVLSWHLALKPGAGRLELRWLGARMAWRFAWRALAVAVWPLVREHARAAKVLRGMYRLLAR
jgi:glycosyltransferase involved in cell wall biosynthesis